MIAHLLHVKILLHRCPEIYVWAHRETYIKRGIKRKPRDNVRVGAGSRQVLLGSICMESSTELVVSVKFVRTPGAKDPERSEVKRTGLA